MKIKALAYTLLLLFISVSYGESQHSIARTWNEEVLHAIRNDFARPTVHARNLWHTSVAMYDIWAIYNDEAEPYFMGNEVNDFEFSFNGIPQSTTPQEDMEEAISYAMYRLLFNRFVRSPGAGNIFFRMNQLMIERGYSLSFNGTDYTTGNPAALGNYVAELIIAFGGNDNSNQQFDYGNLFYEPTNEPLLIFETGIDPLIDPNRWQPLTLEVFIDQSGNPIPGNTPDFLSPEWGSVYSFSLKEEDLNIYTENGNEYFVYHDPGPPPLVDLRNDTEDSEFFKWGFALVSVWSSHLDPTDNVTIDISPGASGNVLEYPTSADQYADFYNIIEGGDTGKGHDINPHTNMPYEPNIVKRADYARVLAEFWADGPDSETPPGHWFTILNYVIDHPDFERRYNGQGPIVEELEWDVKSYFMLGSAMHDCAVTTWGIKGYYDYLRPITAIRSMARRGQSSDPTLPSYDVSGIPLIEGYIELVDFDDPLVGDNFENVNQIKLYAWKGPNFIEDPDSDVAGVDWILAADWMPYQRPSFVSPPFAGYVSGHSTFSRGAADILAHLTGDQYFPGGMAEFVAERNEFLVFEDGPSEDIVLQWATYRDASDQTSLSRIWGGIHPPADDIPGREIGAKIAVDVIEKAEQFMFVDADQDGFLSYLDCNDDDPSIHPDSDEICDGIDNDCSGIPDDNLPLITYYFDGDQDGFGNINLPLDTCALMAPTGYVTNGDDCVDNDDMINPATAEICDAIDNNCDGNADEGLPKNTYYLDFDGDGFGDINITADTCISVPPDGFVVNSFDCDDSNAEINPDAMEICDAIDNDCNGSADQGIPQNIYFFDGDEDGYGDINVIVDTCLMVPPPGYVTNSLDCNDLDEFINPDIIEICDLIDNNCDGNINEGIPTNRYYADTDGDGYGDQNNILDICLDYPPLGFVINLDDCDDSNSSVNPEGEDIPDNNIDEDCNGFDYFREAKVFPNPFENDVTVHLETDKKVFNYLYDTKGNLVYQKTLEFQYNFFKLDLSDYPEGLYYLLILDEDENELYKNTIIKF